MSQPSDIKPTTEPADAGATALDVTRLAPGHAAPHRDRMLTAAELGTFVGQRFGQYEILSEIAKGGMGVVYRARQIALGRVVALKMILAGRLANSEDVARFRAEAEAAAKLQHPNIVAVHDVNHHDGQHFFTMEFIDGQSLDARISEGPLPCKAAARYVRILARAVHYAHKNGILHRDLKPTNILIDADDEPHITDFGLAKRLGPDSGQTRTGAVLGTPSYMSPEQAQGRTTELGPTTDVYSLGAVLYELITGAPPFRGETPLDTVMHVIDHEPAPPALLNPKVDHDLQTICLKCLEKDPSLRYASAEELGDDLQRYLNGDSITARSFNVIDRLARTFERDQHTADFSAWSSMVLVTAAVVLVEHVAVFGFVRTEQSPTFIMAARIMQFVFLGALFWYNRRCQLLPTSAAERELWSIWIGYFTTYFFIVIVTRILIGIDALRIPDDNRMQIYLPELLPYPFIALVSGLAFFVMGANYWGRCYVFGLTFFLLGPVIALDLTLGPLLFGVLWSVTLLILGLHLRQQNQKLQMEREKSKTTNSQAATVLLQKKQ